ncbi:MAG: response regulator [Rubrivivax sp.]
MNAAAGRERPARVLLVEDDAALRGFVAIALEDLPVEVVECDGVAPALAALARAPADLVITDLMLAGGETALALLDRLAGEPQPHSAPVLVCTAAGEAEAQAALAERGVWRVLAKPVPMAELRACVRQALALPAAVAPMDADAGAGPDDGGSAGMAAVTSHGAGPQDPSQDQDHHQRAARRARAVAQHFAGDAELYDRFRDSCLAQFGADIAAGEAASASADLAELRRLLHSLRTVLQLLGHDAEAEQARLAEACAIAGEAAATRAAWSRVCSALRQLPGTAA